MSQSEKLKLCLAVDSVRVVSEHFTQPSPPRPMAWQGPVEKQEYTVEKSLPFVERLCKGWGFLSF